MTHPNQSPPPAAPALPAHEAGGSSLAQMLTRGRLLSRLSHGQVARSLGVHRSHPYQWEHDKRLPKAALLRPLAGLYGLPLERVALAWVEGLAARHGLSVRLLERPE